MTRTSSTRSATGPCRVRSRPRRANGSRSHTGAYSVPALETDDGEWIGGSKEIAAWAERHPATA